MNRIAVIGCSGAGKSTLARELAARTGIPAFHLDQLYWQPGWKPHPDIAAFRGAVDAIVAGESWILDGGFFDNLGPARFERADVVVLLDLAAPADARPLGSRDKCPAMTGVLAFLAPSKTIDISTSIVICLDI